MVESHSVHLRTRHAPVACLSAAAFVAVFAAVLSSSPVFAASRLAPSAHVATHVVPAVVEQQQGACNPYIVKPGDWLSRIWPQTWPTIVAINHLSNPNRIYVGESLCTTGNAGQAAGAPPTTPLTPASAPTTSANVSGEPCRSPLYWANVSAWATPPGCYGAIYTLGYGDCFGWVFHLHPNMHSLAAHSAPVPGAIAKIPGGDQGASPQGHYAEVIAISGSWMLVSEENMYWRGGGFDKVSYRYMIIDGRITFLY